MKAVTAASRVLGAAALLSGLAMTAPAFAADPIDHAAEVAALGGDAKKGERVFGKCKACHYADEDKKKTGPTLLHIFGRHAGAIEDFKYSKAMAGAGEEGLVWTTETLTEYLSNPRKYIKGNRMAFAGLKKEDDIANLLAYLHEASGETPAE